MATTAASAGGSAPAQLHPDHECCICLERPHECLLVPLRPPALLPGLHDCAAGGAGGRRPRAVPAVPPANRDFHPPHVYLRHKCTRGRRNGEQILLQALHPSAQHPCLFPAPSPLPACQLVGAPQPVIHACLLQLSCLAAPACCPPTSRALLNVTERLHVTSACGCGQAAHPVCLPMPRRQAQHAQQGGNPPIQLKGGRAELMQYSVLPGAARATARHGPRAPRAAKPVQPSGSEVKYAGVDCGLRDKRQFGRLGQHHRCAWTSEHARWPLWGAPPWRRRRASGGPRGRAFRRNCARTRCSLALETRLY